MVPMVDAPDEFSHYWVVKFMVEQSRLPTHADVILGGPSAVYGPLPQIGYLPHVLLSRLLPALDVSISGRLGSLVMGLVLVVTCFYIGKQLYPESKLAQLSLPAITLFHPQLVLLHSYTNSDSTAAAVSAVLWWHVIRIIKNGVSNCTSLSIGFWTGIAALSKYSALTVVATSGLSLVIAAFLNNISPVRTICVCGMTGGVFLLTCGWWFIRELQEYPGDILGTRSMRQIWAVTYGRPIIYKGSVWRVVKELDWWRRMFFSFWGMFGYMTIYMWRPIYLAYLAYNLSAALGGILQILQSTALHKFSDIRNVIIRNDEEHQTLKLIWIHWLLILSIVINLSAMIWSSSENLGGAQGRYLFPSEVPIVALLISGLNRLGGKVLMLSFVCFNALVYVYAFLLLLHHYGGFRTKLF